MISILTICMKQEICECQFSLYYDFGWKHVNFMVVSHVIAENMWIGHEQKFTTVVGLKWTVIQQNAYNCFSRVNFLWMWIHRPITNLYIFKKSCDTKYTVPREKLNVLTNKLLSNHFQVFSAHPVTPKGCSKTIASQRKVVQ